MCNLIEQINGYLADHKIDEVIVQNAFTNHPMKDLYIYQKKPNKKTNREEMYSFSLEKKPVSEAIKKIRFSRDEIYNDDF